MHIYNKVSMIHLHLGAILEIKMAAIGNQNAQRQILIIEEGL